MTRRRLPAPSAAAAPPADQSGPKLSVANAHVAALLARPLPAVLRQRLRDRVLAEVRVTPQVRDAVSPAVSPPSRRRESSSAARSRIWLAAAAVLAVVALGSGALAWTQYRAADAARAEAARIDAVVTDPGARLVQQRLPSGGTTTMVVTGTRAVLAGAGMPALASDRTYQLWVIRGPRITSAGLGPAGRNGSGRWSRQVDGVQPGDVLAVSVEPSGGWAQPTTQPLVTLRA